MIKSKIGISIEFSPILQKNNISNHYFNLYRIYFSIKKDDLSKHAYLNRRNIFYEQEPGTLLRTFEPVSPFSKSPPVEAITSFVTLLAMALDTNCNKSFTST